MNAVYPSSAPAAPAGGAPPVTGPLGAAWRDALAAPGLTVRAALAQLDRTMLQILMVADGDGRLIGTLTDGDIRRAILAGTEIDQPVDDFVYRTPFTTTPDANRLALFDTMMRHELRRAPVLDGAGRVIGLRTIEDLAAPPTLPNAAVVMAGGLGTRLRPLTASTPKPMIPVGNRPLLETTLEQLRMTGIETIYLAVNYRAEMIKNHFGDGARFGLAIHYLEERRALGTAGALSLLSERPAHPFVVMNGDLMTGLNFADMIAFHDANRAPLTLCLGEHTYQVPYGVAQVAHGRLTALHEKPDTSFLVNAGIYVIAPEVLDLIPHDTPYDMPTLIDHLIARGDDVATYKLNDYWVDIGRIEDLHHAHAQAAE